MEQTKTTGRTFGLSQLQALRNWRKMTQEQLSDASGVVLSTIQKQERGILNDASLSVACPLAEALDVPIEALIDAAISRKLLEQVAA